MKIMPYSRQCLDDGDIQEVVNILKSDWLTQGPKINEFEAALCKYTGAKYAVAVSSGTAALHIACLAAGVDSNSSVITSPITFVASANSILYCGGRPVFVDVEPDTGNIGPEKIDKFLYRNSAKSGPKIKAVMPVHYSGLPCDMEKIYKIAKEQSLTVIEDAAHALGARFSFKDKWTKVGGCEYSDMTAFSFHPVKSITTGEGGAVTTNDANLYKKLLMLRTHGITKDSDKFINPKDITFNSGNWYYEMQMLGFNYRITDFQCVLGISQLEKLDSFIQKRRKIAEIYQQAFKNNSFFELPAQKSHRESSWHLYPIRLKSEYSKKKKEIFTKLREKGVGAQVHYIPVYAQPYYQKLGYVKDECPNADNFYQEEISIPLYQSMDRENAEYVINTVLEVFDGIK